MSCMSWPARRCVSAADVRPSVTAMLFYPTRIYGDKAADIIDGLRKNPVVAVPLVLRRYVAHTRFTCAAHQL